MESDYFEALELGDKVSRPILEQVINPYTVKWNQFFGTGWNIDCNTSLPVDQIRALTDKLTQLPPGFELQPRVAKIQENRKKMAAGSLPLDWGYCGFFCTS